MSAYFFFFFFKKRKAVCQKKSMSHKTGHLGLFFLKGEALFSLKTISSNMIFIITLPFLTNSYHLFSTNYARVCVKCWSPRVRRTLNWLKSVVREHSTQRHLTSAAAAGPNPPCREACCKVSAGSRDRMGYIYGGPRGKFNMLQPQS